MMSSEVLSLRDIACLQIAQALAGTVPEATQQLLLLQLSTEAFTAVSERLLVEVVDRYPNYVTNDVLIPLVPPHLRQLSIQKCGRVTISGLRRSLSKCSRLERLDLSQCNQLIHIPLFRLLHPAAPCLTSVAMEGCDKVTDPIVQTLILHQPGLRELNISMCANVTNRVFVVNETAQLSHMDVGFRGDSKAAQFSLCSVDLSGCSQLTSTCIGHLATLCGPSLRKINLASCRMDCMVLWYLSGFGFDSVLQILMDDGIDSKACSALLENYETVVKSLLEGAQTSRDDDNSGIDNVPDGRDSQDAICIANDNGATVSCGAGDEVANSNDNKDTRDKDAALASSSYAAPASGNDAAVASGNVATLANNNDAVVANGNDAVVASGNNTLFDSDHESVVAIAGASVSESKNDDNVIICSSDLSVSSDDLITSSSEHLVNSSIPQQNSVCNNTQSLLCNGNASLDKTEHVSLCSQDAAIADVSMESSAQASSDCAGNKSGQFDRLVSKLPGWLQRVIPVSLKNAFAVEKEEEISRDNCGLQEEQSETFCDSSQLCDTAESPRETVHHTDSGADGVSSCPLHGTLSLPSASTKQGPWKLRQMYKPNVHCLDVNMSSFLSDIMGRLCMQAFLSANQSLQQLSVSWPEMNDTIMGVVAELAPELMSLSLVDCAGVSSLGMASVTTACKKLQKLNLQGVNFISDSALLACAVSGRAKSLNLAETNVTDLLLHILATRCQEQLQSLDLSWCEEVTTEGIDAIAQHCTQLRKLSLRHCPVSAQTLGHLTHHSQALTEINLSSVSELEDTDLVALAENLTHLTRVDVSWNCGVTDTGVSSLLIHCIHLRHLVVAGIKLLTSAPFLPIIADVSSWRRTQAVLRLRLHEIQSFPEDGEERLTSDEEDDEIILPHRSLSYAPNLRYVDLEYCDKVDDNIMAEIVAVCRSTLVMRDYYGSHVEPMYIMSRRGKVFMAPQRRQDSSEVED